MLMRSELPNMMGMGLQLALAILLFMKAKLFAQKWWRMQERSGSGSE
jgi:hypothetical protein